MLSAFGVDHGISKSFTHLAPKLLKAANSLEQGGETHLATAAQRTKVGYLTNRYQAGYRPTQMARSDAKEIGAKPGKPMSLEIAIGRKDKAKSQSLANRGRKRFLP